MTWKPKKSDLERIAEFEAAGVALEFAAKFLGATPEEFKSWRRRCMNAAVAEYTRAMQLPPPAPVAKPVFK
jgi:hypothetical protein